MKLLPIAILGLALLVGGALLAKPSRVAAQLPVDCNFENWGRGFTLTVWDEDVGSWVRQTFVCSTPYNSATDGADWRTFHGGGASAHNRANLPNANGRPWSWIKHGPPSWNFNTQTKPQNVQPTGQLVRNHSVGYGTYASTYGYTSSSSGYATAPLNSGGDPIWNNEQTEQVQRTLSQYVSIREACTNHGTLTGRLVRIGDAWYDIPNAADRARYLADSADDDPPPKPLWVVWGIDLPQDFRHC